MLEKLNKKYNIILMLNIAGWSTIIACLVLCIPVFLNSWLFIGLLSKGLFGLILVLFFLIILIIASLVSGSGFLWAAEMLKLSRENNELNTIIADNLYKLANKTEKNNELNTKIVDNLDKLVIKAESNN